MTVAGFLGAACAFERFVEVVRQIGLYWLALNQPPTTP
jgi:hypothetical protein